MPTVLTSVKRTARSLSIVVVSALSSLGALSLAHVGPAHAHGANASLSALTKRLNTDEAMIAALEQKTAPISVSGKDLTITGVNVHIVSGSGRTDDGTTWTVPENHTRKSLTGLGNLIIGYNHKGNFVGAGDVRTGSHNLIIGDENSYSSFGGLVAGASNIISGPYASVSGGEANTASGPQTSVSGGMSNTASGSVDSVSGGSGNTVTGEEASVSGGSSNTASGDGALVSGGNGNTAAGPAASVTGGFHNTAKGNYASVSAGSGNTASGFYASVSGGVDNTADGLSSSVSGGSGVTETTEHGWAAGTLGINGLRDHPAHGGFSSP